jgi:hypothetical protein
MMQTQERREMVAPCGIDCGNCELFICKDDPKLYESLIKRGIPKERIPCAGCREVQGHCPVIPEVCATYTCSNGKKLNFCFECNDFPCNMLQPSADRANVLPHNLKVFNLCTIKNKGLDNFIASYKGIKQKYYQGKMEVGKGPKLI